MREEIPIVLLIIFILFVMFIINPSGFPPKGIHLSLSFIKQNFSTIALIVLVFCVVLIVFALSGESLRTPLNEKLNVREAVIRFVSEEPKMKKAKFVFPGKEEGKEVGKEEGKEVGKEEGKEEGEIATDNDHGAIKEGMTLLKNIKKDCQNRINFNVDNLCEESVCCNNFAVKDNLLHSRGKHQFKEVDFGTPNVQLTEVDYFR